MPLTILPENKKDWKNQLSQGSTKIAQSESKEIKKERNSKNINQERTTTKSRNDDKIKVVSLFKKQMFWYFPSNNGCFLMEDLRWQGSFLLWTCSAWLKLG